MEADGIGIEWSDAGISALVCRPGEPFRPIITSAIVCTAVIVRCEENKRQPLPPWGDPRSRYWWHLEDVEVLDEPVPCKGKQGFWPAPPLQGSTR